MFAPDPSLFDGGFANNAWLQECPKPFTKQVWGNALHLAESDARSLGVVDGDMVRLIAGKAVLEAPVLVRPGQASHTIATTLGYGRAAAGSLGTGIGFDVYRLRPSDSPWALADVSIGKIDGRQNLLLTQHFFELEGEAKDLQPRFTLADLAKPDLGLSKPGGNPATLYPPHDYDTYEWAMVIDTAACIGCNACVVACQAENNVPIVGPDEIAAGRDMHWLRIDDYVIDGKPGFSPVPCMHCEHAPCEPVCPVAASIHDSEGLNLQVYNRCVGTRFCQSNCPYKVRRFNFFGYADGEEYKSFGDDIVKAVFNPDVTVRGRGVMEKCTYCVQRISRARRAAEKDHRKIHDGEVVTACQAACPTRAIAFGDLSDANSQHQRAASGAAGLCASRRTRHAAAHDLSGAPGKSESRLRKGAVMSIAAIRTEPTPPEAVRWTLPGARSLEAVNELVTAPLYERQLWSWKAWWLAAALSGALTVVFLIAVYVVLTRGIGVWGVNTSSVWGFAIADYVWWIGIGNAGTLISSMLLLMRQKWRASTNRFAEAMTLFAATIAGIFPIIHLGRPMYFYWLTPYPNTMTVWPQWRSALIWDFWAILSYILFSLIFWYVGLIPDLATMRDRARSKFAATAYGAFALGWRGSARHWQAYETLHLALACLGVPLVVSLHSVVGMDFAASLMPGWQETIFPPYFVVGAMYSGFAMVVCLAAMVRWGFRHGRPDHGCAFRCHGEGHADGLDRHGAVLCDRMVQRLVRRRSPRPQPGDLRIHRRLCADVLGAAVLQRHRAAGFLDSGRPAQRGRRFRHLGPHQYRDVARTHPDRLEHAVARLPAEHVAAVPSDGMGLAHHDRFARNVRADVPCLCASYSRDLDARSAQAGRRGGFVMTALLLAQFAESTRFVEAARRAKSADYRLVDAFTPFPVEARARTARAAPQPHPRRDVYRRDRDGGAGLRPRILFGGHRLSL